MGNEIHDNPEQRKIEQESIMDIKVDASIKITEVVKILQSLYEGLDDFEAETKTEGLTDEEKEKIKEETGWSDEIIDHIENMEQYEIYKNAGLHEAEIDGRKCLVKDIDMDYVDPKTGMTNRELMAKGRSPIDSKTGEKIELHHMGQDPDSPFVELCENSEHGDGNHSVLHPKNEDSWRNNPELKNQYNNVDKPNHWKERAKEA
ncbi:MAG: hypothetical protein E7289_10835 [Lachnospiraceae bacterium]|nr:hypothetical protein [Lachnospiraceae bacterium]